MAIIKAYKNKELAALYDMSPQSWKRCMKLIKKAIPDLGEQLSGFWPPKAVEKIFNHLGAPSKEFIEK